MKELLLPTLKLNHNFWFYYLSTNSLQKFSLLTWTVLNVEYDRSITVGHTAPWSDTFQWQWRVLEKQFWRRRCLVYESSLPLENENMFLNRKLLQTNDAPIEKVELLTKGRPFFTHFETLFDFVSWHLLVEKKINLEKCITFLCRIFGLEDEHWGSSEHTSLSLVKPFFLT